MKFRPKFFWKWSFSDQIQQPLKGVEPFERIVRALLISECPYKFSSFLDHRNASDRFRLFSRDFRLFRFFFPGSACFSTLASPQNLPSWVKYNGKFESFGKEFRRTESIAVEGVRLSLFFCLSLSSCWSFFLSVGSYFCLFKSLSLTLQSSPFLSLSLALSPFLSFSLFLDFGLHYPSHTGWWCMEMIQSE